MFGSYWRNFQTALEPEAGDVPGRHEMRSTIARILALTERENGQTMAEYAVVLSVIAVSVVTALMVLSGSIFGALDTVTTLV